MNACVFVFGCGGRHGVVGLEGKGWAEGPGDRRIALGATRMGGKGGGQQWTRTAKVTHRPPQNAWGGSCEPPKGRQGADASDGRSHRRAAATAAARRRHRVQT